VDEGRKRVLLISDPVINRKEIVVLVSHLLSLGALAAA
jgi:hypothetical protein